MKYTQLIKTSSLMFCSLLLLSACGGNVKEWDQSEQFPVGSIKTINTEIKAGQITLHHSEDGQIKVNTHFKLTSKRKKELAESIKLEAIPAANALGLRLSLPALEQDENLTSDIEMHVPANLQLSLKNSDGDIALDHLKSSVSVEGVNGNVTDSNHTGNLVVSVQNGNITLTNVTGNSHKLSTQNGTLELDKVTGAVDSYSANGNIIASLLGVNRPEDFRFATVNGNITVKIPSDSSARVRYKKGVGNIKTDFKHLPEQSRIDIGEGAARIHMESTNGNIEVLTQ